MSIFKSIIVPFLGLMLSFIFLSGCNTVNGMGKDLSQGGHAISNAADGDSTTVKKTTTSTTVVRPYTSAQTVTQSTTTVPAQ